jgi:hypothetical protein
MRTKSTCLLCYCTRGRCSGGGKYSGSIPAPNLNVRDVYFSRLIAAQVLPYEGSIYFIRVILLC